MQQYGAGDFGHSTYRGQFSNANNVCRNGSLVDSDYSSMTTTFHRRSKQYNNHLSHKNIQNAVNNNAMVIFVRITVDDAAVDEFSSKDCWWFTPNCLDNCKCTF